MASDHAKMRGDVASAAVRRSRALPGILIAFLAGVLVAVAVPRDNDDGTAGGSTAVAGAGVTSGTPGPKGADAGVVAIDGAPAGMPGAAGVARTGGVRAPAATTGGPGGTAAAATGNGGATFRGVTGNAVKVTALTLDSNTVGSLCPRCGNGEAGRSGGAFTALLAAWRRDGKLPVYGRDIQVTARSYDALSADARRSACVQATQVDKPFLVVAPSGLDSGQCVSQEFKQIFVAGQSGSDDEQLAAVPRIVQVWPTYDKVYRNYVAWADARGLLKNQVLGMYSIADSNGAGIQKNLTRSFREPLKQRGYNLAVDMTYDFAQAASTDTLAVQRFQAAGVTVAFIISPGLAEPNGFQSRAESVGYRPKYPVAETQSETTDALADVTYNQNAQDRNLALQTATWEWQQRRPAVPKSPVAAYCLKAYADHFKRTLDVFDHDAEIHTVLHGCAVLEVVREALVNAGPNLTETSFFQGLYRIKGFQTSDIERVSFGPGRHAGADGFFDAQYRKERWQPSNNYFNTVTAWYPAFVP